MYFLSVCPRFMLVDLEVFYLGHLKNFYTIQYNTIQSPTAMPNSNLRVYVMFTAVCCVFNASVRAVLVGAENSSPDDSVHATRQPRVSTSDRVLHFQARMYVLC